MEIGRCSQLEAKIKNAEMMDKIANFGTAAIVSAIVGGIAGYVSLNTQNNHIWGISTPIAFGGVTGMIYFSFKAAKNFKKLARGYKN